MNAIPAPRQSPTSRKPQSDTQPEQAARAADHLERNPDSTLKKADAVCHIGCICKVLSDIPGLGCGIAKGWRDVTCAAGSRTRQVRTYRLPYRPTTLPDLFTARA